jgi:hypothetical protein
MMWVRLMLAPHADRLAGLVQRRSLFPRPVRPVLVVVPRILGQDSPEVPFAVDMAVPPQRVLLRQTDCSDDKPTMLGIVGVRPGLRCLLVSCFFAASLRRGVRRAHPSESFRRSAAAYRHDEDEYRQGRSFGGRPLPPGVIEALAGPAAAAARDSIRWARGAEPASVTAGRARRGGRPGGAVGAMIDASRRGARGLQPRAPESRARRWPAVPRVCPPALETAAPAVDDLEPYVPGSFDDVVLAYDLGKLSDDEYEFLAEAASISVPGPG